jgi:hypothetical protein
LENLSQEQIRVEEERESLLRGDIIVHAGRNSIEEIGEVLAQSLAP